jgi:hypothetical protein
MTPLCRDDTAPDPNRLSKEAVLAAFRSVLALRLEQTRQELEALDQAAAGETKSSAGDKYETAREMIGQARAMQHRIRDEAQTCLDWLDRQDPSVVARTFALGSLVCTPGGWFLVCPSPVELEVNEIRVQGVTLASPFGQACKGTHEGETRAFRDRMVEILRIL